MNLIPMILSESQQAYFQDFSPNVLERHIKVSRHLPVCVIFRINYETGSKLEEKVYKLWKNSSTSSNYKQWEFGSYYFQRKHMIKLRQPEHLPAFECFLGETSAHLYQGKSTKKELHQWLQQLAEKHEDQLQDASVDLVERAVEHHDVTILAFPDHHRHHDIEEMVFQLCENTVGCKAFVIHQHALNAGELKRLYKVTLIPSVLIITKDRFRKNRQVHRLFARQHLTKLILQTHVFARSINATHYNEDEFEKNIITLRGTRYFPKIITFYAYWGTNVREYLTAFQRSIDIFNELHLPVRFGLMDLTQDSNQKTISKWIQADYVRKVPFTVAFYTDSKNMKLIQSGFTDDRPTPLSLFPLIQQTGEDLKDQEGAPLVYQPWGTIDEKQITPAYEGPFGLMCSAWSHNETNNNPPPPKKVKVTTSHKLKKKPSWHERYGTESVDRVLRKLQGIPLLSGTSWSEVIEKSHAPNHPFHGGKQWAGEVTKVALVIFIKEDCRSCNRSMDVFKQLQQSVKFLEGGSVYLVNCTAEVSLCSTHKIRGYPYITAFRGLGWMGTTHCVSAESRTKYKNFIRMDYHGVIQEKQIMEWFTNTAGPAITNMFFKWPNKNNMVENVQVIGILMPKMSRFLPIPPDRNIHYYYSYECFRLACERLYGKATCYGVYSSEIPEKEYHVEDLEVIVSRVLMRRKDGVSADLTHLGKSLMDTMEDQSDSILHRFHRPHRYNLRVNQKCEDDHAACTDLITAFTLDHSRLPITHITSDAFHTEDKTDDDELPVLIAMVHQDNITINSPFLQLLSSIAYDLYNYIMVTTLDVDQYPAWSGQFVPRDYGRTMIKEDGDPEQLFTYPRICIVQRRNHHKAAFYPPLNETKDYKTMFTRKKLKSFIDKALKNKDEYFVATEHF